MQRLRNQFRLYGICTLSEGKRHVLEVDYPNGHYETLEVFTRNDVNLFSKMVIVQGHISRNDDGIQLLADTIDELEESVRK